MVSGFSRFALPFTLAAFTLAAFALAACTSGQQSRQLGGVVPSNHWSGPLSNSPDRDYCRGSHGVKVRPCPITLYAPSEFSSVTVSGPGVVSSRFCCIHKFNALRRGRNALKWTIVPLGCEDRGHGSGWFTGYNSSGKGVGDATLDVKFRMTC